jgi:hypothetical protein
MPVYRSKRDVSLPTVVFCVGSNNSICSLLKKLFGDAFTKTVINNVTVIVIVVEGNLITSTRILNEPTAVPRFWNRDDHAKLPQYIAVSGVKNGTYIFCRHAESAKNIADSSVAIEDPHITPAGHQQVVEAIPLIRAYLDEHGLVISHVFNSVLTRTIQTAEAIVEAFDLPEHHAVLWLQEFMRRINTPHHVVGTGAPTSSAVALNPFHPQELYRKYREICVPETPYNELLAMQAEITFKLEGKEVFRKLNMSLALYDLKTVIWAERVVELDLLQWASKTVSCLSFIRSLRK